MYAAQRRRAAACTPRSGAKRRDVWLQANGARIRIRAGSDTAACTPRSGAKRQRVRRAAAPRGSVYAAQRRRAARRVHIVSAGAGSAGAALPGCNRQVRRRAIAAAIVAATVAAAIAAAAFAAAVRRLKRDHSIHRGLLIAASSSIVLCSTALSPPKAPKAPLTEICVN